MLAARCCGYLSSQSADEFPLRLRFKEPTMLTRISSAVLFIATGITAFAPAQDKPIASRPPWTTSRVRGSPEPPAPYRLSVAFHQLRFELPTSLEEVPGTNRLLVTERAGRISTF